MANLPSNTDRLIQVAPLLNQAFVGYKLKGIEGLSQLFQFSLTCLIDNDKFQIQSLLQQMISVQIAHHNEKPRLLHGMIQHAQRINTPNSQSLQTIELTIVPQLWMLTQLPKQRIFRKLSALDIANQILSENNIINVNLKLLENTYHKVDYIVQYNENDFDFLMRLFSEYGIFYYFNHFADHHDLVL